MARCKNWGASLFSYEALQGIPHTICAMCYFVFVPLI